MTPKIKAEEIYNRCLDKIQGLEGTEWWESAKQCALIAVDEIIYEYFVISYRTEGSNLRLPFEWWESVKGEIEKL